MFPLHDSHESVLRCSWSHMCDRCFTQWAPGDFRCFKETGVWRACYVCGFLLWLRSFIARNLLVFFKVPKLHFYNITSAHHAVQKCRWNCKIYFVSELCQALKNLIKILYAHLFLAAVFFPPIFSLEAVVEGKFWQLIGWDESRF